MIVELNGRHQIGGSRISGNKRKKTRMRAYKPHTHSPDCQITCLGSMCEPVGPGEKVQLRLRRLRRYIRRGRIYLINWLRKVTGARRTTSAPTANSKSRSVKVGDLVRVRSREEIQAVLNYRNKLKGCAFMDEMWPYCGTIQRIQTVVKRFIDERDYQMKKCRGIVFLEGAICEGTSDFGPCDRACFFFWREEWLEKVD